jgi:hypothetical protein
MKMPQSVILPVLHTDLFMASGHQGVNFEMFDIKVLETKMRLPQWVEAGGS